MADGTACGIKILLLHRAGAHKESAASTLQFMAHGGDEAFFPPEGDVVKSMYFHRNGQRVSQASNPSSGPTSLQAAFMLRRNCLTVL